MPAVGYALLHACCGLRSSYQLWVRSFLPAVGPLFWFLFIRIIHLFEFHSGFWLELCSFPGVAVCECVNLAPRAPYPPSSAVWCLGLSRACVISTSCSPVHVLTHVFAVRGLVSPRTTRSPPLHTAVCVEGVVSRDRLFHSLHGRELRRAACVATLVRRREHLVAEPVPRRSAHCAFRRALLCSVSRDRALWYSLTCGLLN